MKTYYFRKPDNYNILVGAIRSKNDLLLAFLRLIRFFNSYPINSIKGDESHAEIWISIDEMSRCFLIEENKIHSFQIPGLLSESDGFLRVSIGGKHIDSKMCSFLESLFIQINDTYCSFDRLFDCFSELLDEFDIKDFFLIDSCWNVFMLLFESEGGYVRYDHDTNNADEITHPIDHLDVFYSRSCTFKIGINAPINAKDFRSIINNRDKRFYLNYCS